MATALAATASPASAETLAASAAAPLPPGPLSAAQQRVLSQGYLVPDQAAYDSAKSAAAARAPQATAAPTLTGPFTPIAAPSFAGLRDTNVAPPDTTGAVGKTRFIETINNKFGIYSKTSTTPISTGTLASLWGSGSAGTTDPQVIWDPSTSRFYYAGLALVSSTSNELTFGFSKTSAPNSAADFCKYLVNYGTKLPDYPKLGDTSNFLLIGTNTFASTAGGYLGSDLVGISKPPSGSTCPDAGTFVVSVASGIKNHDGTQAFTPVPANQTDGSSAGWVVAIDHNNPSSTLSLFKVTKNANGTPNFQTTGTDLKVPTYSVPPSAPQPQTSSVIDTLDARNTQAVSAIDPARGRVGLWTQHTIAAGAGAGVRWYEIDPVRDRVFQQGTISSSTLYRFNGAISPNRVANGATLAFGSDMVITFNASSSSARPRIQVASKIGAGTLSSAVTVKSSSVSLNDFSCSPGPCRWGDYAGATPDPAPPSGSSRVWAVNEWVAATGSFSASGGGSWNFAVTP